VYIYILLVKYQDRIWHGKNRDMGVLNRDMGVMHVDMYPGHMLD
jgi:hypothetical protein